MLHSVKINCCKWVQFVVLWRNWCLRGTLRLWPDHTLRVMRDGWCGGRASLFWVRGTTGMELIQDNNDFRVWLCINENCPLIFFTKCCLFDKIIVLFITAVLRYDQALCYLHHAVHKTALVLALRNNKAWWEGSSEKKHEVWQRMVLICLFIIYMLFNWFQ